MDEAPLSANFVMYKGHLRIQHTIRSAGDIVEHLEALDLLVGRLAERGHTLTEPGLEPGEESLNADGYVVSTDKTGKHILWWYDSRQKYALKGGTVYNDHWDDLFFEPKIIKVFEGEQKPTTEFAKAKGLFVPQKARIVVKDSGKLHEGTGAKIFRFVAAYPLEDSPAPPESPPPAASAPATTAPATTPEQLLQTIVEYIGSGADTPEKLVKAVEKAAARKEEIGTGEWAKVQHAVQDRVALFLSDFEGEEWVTQREALKAAVKRIGPHLEEGYVNQTCATIAELNGVPW